MRKILFLIVFAASAFLSYKYFFTEKNKSVDSPKIKIKETFEDKKTSIKSRSLFVPSWSLNQEVLPSDYDRYIYFGITANKEGIDVSDDGFKRMNDFLKAVPQEKKKDLTLRLTNEEINDYILKNPDLENKIIQQTLDIAKVNKFDGIVLDLESNNYINQDFPEQVNEFVQSFYLSAKKYYITFSLTIYGDTFYRKRQFDIATLSKNSDEIMIMAYDLHKSGGEPGPNFPLAGRASYGYDFKSMIEDFSSIIPKEKISVIFGMFGYDWSVDEKKLPVKPAEALSLNDIKKKFLGKCIWQDCVVKRDEISRETEVDYVMSEVKQDYGYLYYHIVWFEDEQSVKDKTEYLLENGIDKISYWANGYF